VVGFKHEEQFLLSSPTGQVHQSGRPAVEEEDIELVQMRGKSLYLVSVGDVGSAKTRLAPWTREDESVSAAKSGGDDLDNGTCRLAMTSDRVIRPLPGQCDSFAKEALTQAISQRVIARVR
jgi:hypothetical protein